MTKTAVGMLALLVLSLFVLPGGAPAPGQQPPAKATEARVPALFAVKPIKPAAGDSELQKLLKERYNAAVAEVQEDRKLVGLGVLALQDVLGAQKRLLDAGLELKDQSADRIAWLKDHVELAKAIEVQTKLRYEAGQASLAQLAQAHYSRVDIEIRLLRERAKARRG